MFLNKHPTIMGLAKKKRKKKEEEEEEDWHAGLFV